jgi:hypothetical protein
LKEDIKTQKNTLRIKAFIVGDLSLTGRKTIGNISANNIFLMKLKSSAFSGMKHERILIYAIRAKSII